MSELTIIILTYNSQHIIKSCLENINFEKYKVIIVDNNSSDNTVSLVRDNFLKAEIITLKQNIGYGNGNNIALQKVETEFALILNPDAMIFEKDIEIILSEMKANSLVAMASPLVLDNYPIKQEEIDKKIAHIENDFKTIQDGHYEKIGNNFSVRFLIGAILFMKISLMKKIGFFDKNIFLYYEDDEICGRVRDNGYHNLLVTSAYGFHINGGGRSSSNMNIVFRKNWHLTWSKMYWKKLKKGNLRAKRSSLKLSIVYFFQSIFFAIKLDKIEFISHFGRMLGAFSFLIGLKAFKKNGNPRG